MTAEVIARALNGRRSGRGWMCCCPAHQDKTPSLSIREVHGKLLLHYFSGCRQADVIEALRSRRLWPEPERRKLTAHERTDWARSRARAERFARLVQLWQFGFLCRLEDLKLAAYHRNDFTGLAVVSPQIFELDTASPERLIEMFNTANPEERAADIIRAQQHFEASEKFAAWVVAKLAELEEIDAKR